MDLHQRITRDFAYQRPRPEVTLKIDYLREQIEVLAHALADELPISREQSTAITKLEEVLFWSRAALIRKAMDDGEVD